MSAPHVALPSSLTLPREFAHGQGYLDQHDPELRIRRSAEVPHLFVLERRCRRRSRSNLGMRDRSDMHIQLRDGYLHVSTVHPTYLLRPWNMVRALREEGFDMFARTAASVDDELLYEKAWAAVTRKRRRRQKYKDIANDSVTPTSTHVH